MVVYHDRFVGGGPAPYVDIKVRENMGGYFVQPNITTNSKFVNK